MTQSQVIPKRYFVALLQAEAQDEQARSTVYQVQILDDTDRAIHVINIALLLSENEDFDAAIPIAVIQAATRQQLGQGNYVDERGAIISPLS